jgi:hypothetical protein
MKSNHWKQGAIKNKLSRKKASEILAQRNQEYANRDVMERYNEISKNQEL